MSGSQQRSVEGMDHLTGLTHDTFARTRRETTVPYRARGATVQKQQSDGSWVVHKRHSTPAKAKAHAAALNINVDHPGKAKKTKRDA